MTTLSALALTLLVLMLAVGGKQGLSDAFALLLNAGLMILAVILIAGGFAPLAVAAVIGLIVLAVTIFLSTTDMNVAGPAFVASLLVMTGVIAVVVVGVLFSHTGGFGAEDTEDLEGFSLTVGVSFQQVLIATGLLSTLGAIAEAATAVAAGLIELGDDATAAGRQDIAQAIIGTALNTLFFGFFGGFSALFIWFAKLRYPFWEVLNDQIFAGELIQVLFSVIAVAATVPMTMWVVGRRHREEG
ncbi:YibE/F family protein [Lacticaseibacillus mingshuiensis]|uniref:YibE/F family protein n=1 Tax=Lacticaseibacillus mingshuiensis TaxID=2799574 RepID=A0ABW4CG53_9LACO|nr:YibE/F family protein [Lacticaseibacillus mingshuiensis]